jgi:hypothetical protein
VLAATLNIKESAFARGSVFCGRIRKTDPYICSCIAILIGRLFIYCFTCTSRPKNFHLHGDGHHYRCRAVNLRPMLGAQGLGEERVLYRATPAVTRDLGFSGFIRRATHLLSPITTCKDILYWRHILNGIPTVLLTWNINDLKDLYILWSKSVWFN